MGDASAFALAAGHPEGLDDRPAILQSVDGDPAYEWARVAWAAAKATPGAWYDAAFADHVVEAWPKWATLTLDRFRGVSFRLATWQEIVVRLLTAWTVPSEALDPLTHEPITLHVRLFRRLLLWVQRKNGKSEFLAALALLFFALDGVAQGEGYVFAAKEDQARVVYNRMTAMIGANEQLAAGIIAHAKSFYVKRLRSTFYVMTGSEKGVHGKSPTVIVGDEMHEWRSTVIADTLRQGTGGRAQPIELYASTAGRKAGGHSPGEQLYEETRKIIAGEKVDASTLAVIFAANDNDDPGLEATWRKANPNLGLSPLIDAIRREFELTKGNPRKLVDFKCYHLGIWADPTAKWLPLRAWDACTADPKAWKSNPERFKGRPCWLAFDISATRDVTARVLVFPPSEEDPKWTIVPRFWIPADRVAERTAEGSPVEHLIALGALETTDGNYVDQNAVGFDILECVRDYDVQRIGFDKWNASKLYTDLTSASGLFEGSQPIPVELFHEMRQGIPTLGEPSKEFERLVFAGLLDHGGHPTLRWMAGNVVVHFDRNLNFMPAKDRSADKIDGIVAGVMAIGLAMAGDATPRSPYEDPGFSMGRAA